MSKKLFLFILLSPFIGSLAMAQDSTIRQLDQVVVTATKSPVKQNQTGKVVIVIAKEELEKSAGKTLGQVLNEQAGIIVNGALNNMGSNQSIYLRGAPSGRTLVTIDGVPVSDPSMINNEFDINLVPVELIERIEICKGAQSTLYGSDAIAGVINIITARADAKKPLNLIAGLGGGNEQTYRANLQLYGKEKTLLYDLRYSRVATQGFPSAYDSTGKGNFHNDGYQGDALASHIDWNANSQLTLKGFVQFNRYKTGLPQGAFTDAQDYSLTSKNLILGGGFSYKLPSVSLTGNYYYTQSNRLNFQDTIHQPNYLSDQYFGKTQFVEIYANISLGHGFSLLNGADYRFSSMNEQYLSISSYGPYSSRFDDTSVSQTSMYGSLFYVGKSGLRMELGGRLNTHSRYGSNYTYTFNPSFLIGADWMLFASVASGFKAPSLYQLYSSYGDPDLRPEKSLNLEAGLQFNNDFFNSRLSYFNRKIQDGIDFNYNSYLYFNYNQERAQGIEWENKIRINPWLSLSANYTFLKVTQSSESRISFQDTTYGYALRQPEHTLNATIGLNPVKKGFLSISGHYESKRYDIGGYQVPDVSLNSFFILNGYAEYRPWNSLKFFIDAKNITNKKFFTIYGYNSIPFLILGGISFNL
jgi:vitamin B12 transporter